MTKDERSKLIDNLRLLDEIEKRKAKNDYHLYSKKYLWITNKKGRRVKLKQNAVQRQLEKRIEAIRADGLPVRLIVLKSRQMGISTDTEGRMMFETATKENRNGLVVAHRTDSTQALFAKTKYFHDHLDIGVKPLQKNSNATELIFNRPSHYAGKQEGLNSKIKIQTAGKAGIGRSDTIHYCHLSEFAFWEGRDKDAPANQLAGIMQAVPDDPDTWVIIESTANGINDFKEEWDKAVRGESAFTPIFLAWYEHEEYVREVHDELSFIDSMSEYEEWLHRDLHLPLYRVNWWRWALKNKCNGDINTMKQENPTTPEEAFIFSGTPVFNNDAISQRIAELETSVRDIREGYFDFKWHDEEYKDYILPETIKFVESKQKPYFRLYGDRIINVPYAIAGDTKGEGKDEYTAQVMDNTTQQRVATCQMQLNNSKPYSWQMYCAGRYFNNALIGIEMNFNTAPLEELQRLRYPRQYYREKPEGFRGERTPGKIGWKTDGITRPRMIDKEVYVVDEYLHLLHDVPTLRQMLTFAYDKNGRPDAMSGHHDDLLIADCILNEISDQQRKIPNVPPTDEHYDFNFLKPKPNALRGGEIDDSYINGGW